MKISVFGIGYVGAVASACLAKTGHSVIAVDPYKGKVDFINQGRSPIVEPDLDPLIKEAVDGGKLRATQDYRDAVMNSEISLICVGTPSEKDGSLDYKYINEICKEIGACLKDKAERHIVVVRSTVVPGTLMNIVKPALEQASGKVAGKDFGLGNNPEFLRESTAVDDYFNPTQIVVGATDEQTAEKIMGMYDGIEGNRFNTTVDVAEGVKYVSNSWRANKISFANEMGNILKRHGVDSHKVMKIFFQDTKINMGPSFLLPGFAFGGSCLPKDIKAIRTSANDRGLPTPVFDSMLEANELQVKHAKDLIDTAGKKKVLLLGVSFKPNTDDVRESPLVTLAQLLVADGYDLTIFDPCVNEACEMGGANKEYIEKSLPEIYSRLSKDAAKAVSDADTIIIGNGTKSFTEIVKKADEQKTIIDLCRLDEQFEKRKNYVGICW